MRIFKDKQILSAIIWADAILLSSIFAPDSNVPIMLITAAGFHVVMMSQLSRNKNKRVSDCS